MPPLKYDWVLKLKKEFPHLEMVINGGFVTTESIEEILEPENELMGCMVGRMAQNNTWQVSKFDRIFFKDLEPEQEKTREQLLKTYAEFVQLEQDKQIAKGRKPLSNTILVRPLINLF